jgi:hypothetical protein
MCSSQYGEKHLEQLRSAGIELTAKETYLSGGRFKMDAMLARIQETLKIAAALGFPLTRTVADVAEEVLEAGPTSMSGSSTRRG